MSFLKNIGETYAQRISLGAIFVLGSFLLVSGQAQAACTKVGYNKYDPAKGMGSDFYYVSDNGSCTVAHGIEGRQGAYRYTETRVLEPAKNGTVKYLHLTKWTYVAKPGFSGTDTFKLHVCAESTIGKGCAVLNYKLQVKRG